MHIYHDWQYRTLTHERPAALLWDSRMKNDVRHWTRIRGRLEHGSDLQEHEKSARCNTRAGLCLLQSENVQTLEVLKLLACV